METNNLQTHLKPFLSTLNHHATNFPEIAEDSFLPAAQEAITLAKNRIEEIKSQPASFENTIEKLESAAEEFSVVASVFYNLFGAHTNEKLQSLAQEIGPMGSDFSNDVLHDAELFAKVEEVYKSKSSLDLTAEQSQLLENTHSDFVRNGAKLDQKQKEKLREIDQNLSKLSPKFGENVLKATNAFQLILESEDELAGLPASMREAAAHAASEAGMDGKWLITLHAPSFAPFLKYSEKRELRERVWKAYASRAVGGEFDNREIVKEIAKLKKQRAQLLGYSSHAEFTLEKRMAETPSKVMKFLDKLKSASKRAAEKEVHEIQYLADEIQGPNPVMPWDFSFYAEKLKQKKFEFDAEELRPYFQLDKVVEGAFEHARRLYGVVFKASSKYPVYHDDVKVYEVFEEDSNEFVGLFYTDFHPRASKRDGAWMTNFLEQGRFRGELNRPHVSIVCNFTKPTADKPSLLTFGEVETLFHEFGHGLHSLLSQCTYQGLSGTNVYWDFVELPSQIMENWLLEKESLDLFARHYETDEAIPEDLAKKIKDSSKFLAGYNSLRQVNFATLDMAWYHNHDPEQINDVESFEREVTADTLVLPVVDGMVFSCGFSHIFAGGYSAGYYSYKWAEVLDADAFELFKEKGIFNREVAKKFRSTVLSQGGSRHPMELFVEFRGREPDPDALLRRDGLI